MKRKQTFYFYSENLFKFLYIICRHVLMISFVIKTNYKKPIVFQAGHSVWILGLGLGV